VQHGADALPSRLCGRRENGVPVLDVTIQYRALEASTGETRGEALVRSQCFW
jgi:hypothetical protein